MNSFLYLLDCLIKTEPLDGSLPFKQGLVQQKRDYPYVHDALIVLPRILIIARDNDFAERIARLPQGQGLLLSLFIRRHRIRRLDIDALARKVHDKINLMLPLLALSALARLV